MYTHTECPICTANKVKDEHDLQIIRAQDLYEEPFLRALDLFDKKSGEFLPLFRAYCGYHNDFVSQWYTTSEDALSNLYPKEPFPPTEPMEWMPAIASRLNLPNIRLQFQFDFLRVVFIKATFTVRSGTVQRYGYYILDVRYSEHEGTITFINCQEINTGKIRKTKMATRWNYNDMIIKAIAADFTQWQILEGQ